MIETQEKIKLDMQIKALMLILIEDSLGILKMETIDRRVVQHLQTAALEIGKAFAIVDANVNGDYKAYLESDQWKMIQTLVRVRDNFKCQRCMQGQEVVEGGVFHDAYPAFQNLDVHHMTYERRGCESLDDLRLLCRSCHRHVHESGLFERGLINETPEEYAEMERLNPL